MVQNRKRKLLLALKLPETVDYLSLTISTLFTVFLMAARGRPLLIVSRSELEHLLSLRFTWSEIAAILNVSVKTLQRRAKEWDLTRYTNTTLATLEESVREILHNFPSCGEVMINGHLKSNEVSTGPVTGTLSRGYRSGSYTRGDIRMRIMIFT